MTQPTTRDALALAGYALFAGVLLSPIRHYFGDIEKVTRAKNEEDSFPLSTYPMFSADRKGRIIVPHVVGYTADGEPRIPHYEHFGLGGLNQVRRQISQALREGRGVEVAQVYADSLARQRDRRVKAGTKRGDRAIREREIVEIQVVRSRFIFDDWFAGKRTPKAEQIHARCEVGGTAVAGDKKMRKYRGRR